MSDLAKADAITNTSDIPPNVRRATRILRQDPDGLIVVVPLTTAAAHWWGKGTKWPITRAGGDSFEELSESGPQIIFQLPELGNAGRFFVYASQFTFFLLDFKNSAIATQNSPSVSSPFVSRESQKVIENNWGRLAPLLKSFAEIMGLPLAAIPLARRHEALSAKAVCSNGNALRHVPHDLRSPAICEAAVRQSGDALQFVPYHLRTESLCDLAVNKNGSALEHVPPAFLTKARCRAAIQNNGWAIGYTPDEFIDAELTELAVAREPLVLRYPDSDKIVATPHLWEIAVRHDGRALAYIPKAEITAELCILGVRSSWRALGSVPNELITAELCREAVLHDPKSLPFVPRDLLDLTLCEMAVRRMPSIFFKIPKDLQTALLEKGPDLKRLIKASKATEPKYSPAWLPLLDDLERALQTEEYGHEAPGLSC